MQRDVPRATMDAGFNSQHQCKQRHAHWNAVISLAMRFGSNLVNPALEQLDRFTSGN